MGSHQISSLAKAIRPIAKTDTNKSISQPIHSSNHPTQLHPTHTQTNIPSKKQTNMFGDFLPLTSVFAKPNPLDFEWVGNRITKPKPSHSRILIQNLNGISPSNNFLSYYDLLMEFNKYNIELFLFSEHKLNACNFKNRDSIDAIHQFALPGAIHKLSNIHVTSSETYIHGGTLSIAHGKLARRLAESGEDKFGRFNWAQ